jgi:hypothetical protein
MSSDNVDARILGAAYEMVDRGSMRMSSASCAVFVAFRVSPVRVPMGSLRECFGTYVQPLLASGYAAHYSR